MYSVPILDNGTCTLYCAYPRADVLYEGGGGFIRVFDEFANVDTPDYGGQGGLGFRVDFLLSVKSQ
jgi:hypothetical protein